MTNKTTTFYRKYNKHLCLSLLIAGIFLLVVNIIGLFLTLRNDDLFHEKLLRFGENDIQIDYPDILKKIIRNKNETDYEYALRINKVIPKGLAHIEWKKIQDPDKYHQRIPFWENYILYALSYSPWFDDFKRYHFRDYKKTFERGIGICGDAAMVLSAVLTEHKMKAKIIAFSRGHVINEVYVNQKNSPWYTFDPDFGVVLPFNIQVLSSNPSAIRPYYKKGGYSDDEIDVLVYIYKGPFTPFKDVEDFGPTTLLVERMSYQLKWIAPISFIAIYFIWLWRNQKVVNGFS